MSANTEVDRDGDRDEEVGRQPRILEKVEEEDYRGIMSLILIGGYVVGVVVGAVVRPDSIAVISAVLGPLAGAAVGWYFREKAGK